MKSQIWIAVSIDVLVAIIKKRLNLKIELYTILQILSLTLFEKTPLDQLLMISEYQSEMSEMTSAPRTKPRLYRPKLRRHPDYLGPDVRRRYNLQFLIIATILRRRAPFAIGKCTKFKMSCTRNYWPM